ncbi:54S ribosomal protein L3 mitochondrial [Cladophialophora chaetospira]|uniref:Large ribosomal subunit protein mL44 n=1 Tax=Cladophialophora chaetospira TaxID=386627 RepID=A0AA39CMD1_9EURO|nr:54S ribosomal protein L3 mitochondrial [Cladophialophora chaetospira]
MKRLRLLRWSGSVLSPRTRPDILPSPFCRIRRFQATAAAPVDAEDDLVSHSTEGPYLSEEELVKLPSPPVTAARTSAKLAALHARLSLPSRFPLETLARTLVDESADISVRFNNKPFASLGNDLLGYYTSEYIISQYPRLPLAVVYAAMYAYHGPATLTQMAREWGVEVAAEPGGEVDPGLLQFKRMPPDIRLEKDGPAAENNNDDPRAKWTRSLSAKSVHNDQFGELQERPIPAEDLRSKGVTLQRASTNFVRAVIGAVYLHAGRAAAKKFYGDHFMSRQLDMSSLFQFKNPTRDLSKLCGREGFQAPVAKILSETGRKSRTPVFVVGIYSGSDLLGEGAGASLDEARTRAAVAALKGWYLYSPTEFRLPSETEEPGAKPWTPILVDAGEIVA